MQTLTINFNLTVTMEKDLDLKNLEMDKNLIIIAKSKLDTLNRKIAKLQKEKEKLNKEKSLLEDTIRLLKEEKEKLNRKPIYILNKKVKERYKEKIKYQEEIAQSLRKDNDSLSMLAYDLWHRIAKLEQEVVELNKKTKK